MRREFADELHGQMKFNENIWLLVGDLGYKVFDKHKQDFPDRVLNCGASEQAMMDIAVGLAYEGKKVFVYSITPFLLYRAFETIRTYIAHEQLPVVLVGSGRDMDYAHDGYSHNAEDVRVILGALGGLTMYFPETELPISKIVEDSIVSTVPVFISLQR